MTARDDWLEWRRGGIGASDMAALMGISPWASPWSVWADKCGLLPPQPEDEYMTAGRWLEAAIGPWFENETGLVVAGEQMQCTARGRGWMRATPDGFVYESPLRGSALGTFEVKVTGPGRRWDQLPPYYQAQGQWQMAVTEVERVWFAVLMGRRLDIHELARDEADIEFMVERAECFWIDHVIAGVPPGTDASDATARALAAVYPDAVPGASVEVFAGHVHSWLEAKARAKDAEITEKEAGNRLKAALGDKEEGTVDGYRRVSWRPQSRTIVCKGCGEKVSHSEFRVLRHHKPKESR